MSFFTEEEEKVLRTLKVEPDCTADEATYRSLLDLGFIFRRGSMFVPSGNGGDGTHQDDWATEYTVGLTKSGKQALARLT